eukprot:TRINITY_DN11491_c0_g1_i1.p1 TRINITY_DN11491_c0_g1~~TRINITY_DN11491_c0_g1_i1.p1  ORF type:complete len:693 (+),score=240.93 TRINITY_DN11491_c0_g1_i1:67-2079(+)
MLRQNMLQIAMTRQKSAMTSTLSPQQIIKLRDLFNQMDVDGNGSLSIVEAQGLWRAMFPNSTAGQREADIHEMWQMIDTDGDNEVSFKELLDHLWGSSEAEFDPDQIERHYARPLDLGEWVWALVDQPTSLCYDCAPLRRAAAAVGAVVQSAILCSVGVIVAESMPEMQDPDADGGATGGNAATFTVEAICVAVFSVEFLLRALSAPRLAAFWLSFWTAVDIVSIVPFYLELSGLLDAHSAAAGLIVLRVLRLARLFRVLRVFKLSRGSEGAQIMVGAVQRSITAIVWLVLTVCLAMLLFGALIFHVEKEDADFVWHRYKGSDVRQRLWVRAATSVLPDAGQPLTMQSIPSAAWWALVTMSTVGFGDSYPATDVGKCVALLAMYAGMLVTAFLTTMLCNNFTEAMHDHKRRTLIKEKRQQHNRNAHVLAPGGAASRVAHAAFGIAEQEMWRDGVPAPQVEQRVLLERRSTFRNSVAAALSGQSEEGSVVLSDEGWTRAASRSSVTLLAFSRLAERNCSLGQGLGLSGEKGRRATRVKWAGETCNSGPPSARARPGCSSPRGDADGARTAAQAARPRALSGRHTPPLQPQSRPQPRGRLAGSRLGAELLAAVQRVAEAGGAQRERCYAEADERLSRVAAQLDGGGGDRCTLRELREEVTELRMLVKAQMRN